MNSKIVNCCYRVNDILPSLSLYTDVTNFKLYVGDTGLFATMLFNSEDRAHEDIYKKLLSDKLGLNLGFLCENVLAQMIVASKWCLYYFAFPKERSGNYEIGFLLSNKSKAIPLEVKSRQVKFHISIDQFGGGIRLNRFLFICPQSCLLFLAFRRID